MSQELELNFDTRDEYNRKIIAEKIVTLLESPISISPIVIDGGWGTGKTEFSKKLATLINKKNDTHKVIYIDAFAEDHNDAPILTIMAAIVTLFPNDDKKELISKALPAIRFGLKTVFKAGTGWILKQNASDIAEGLEDAIKDAANSAIDGTVEALLDDHIEAQKNIFALKQVLSELTSDKKITIIVDELDRCKPSFALSIIENIKHVFDISNLNFLLVANTSQLKASINHIYGSSVNSEQYLDKFVRFTFSLPITFKVNGHDDVLTSVYHWQKICSQSESLNLANERCGAFFEHFIKCKKISLREVETLARYVEIYQLFTGDGISIQKQIGYCFYRTLAVILYCFGRDIALSYLDDNIAPEALLNVFGVTKFDYGADKYKVHNFERALFGITYKHIPIISSLNPPNQEIKKEWVDICDYEFLKDASGFSEPSLIFKQAIKSFLMQ